MSKSDALKAAETRRSTAAQAVAAAVAAKPASQRAERHDAAPSSGRINGFVPTAVLDEVDEFLLELKRAGAATSISGLVEVALRELLGRPDRIQAVRSYGVGKKRAR